MKRIILIATALLAGIGLYAQQMPPIPVDEAVRIGQLENGLTYTSDTTKNLRDRPISTLPRK